MILACGCAHYVPDAGADRAVAAGKLSRIALKVPPPEGKKIVWDAGDGTQPFQGPELAHAWQKPGRYQVTVTADGNVDELFVQVDSRPVLDVIPAAAKLAFLVPQPWKLLPRIRNLLGDVTLPVEFRRTLFELAEKAGAGGSDQALVDHGIDPAEGLAIVVMPEDHGAWLLLGTLDDARALELGRALTELKDAPLKDMDGAHFAFGEDASGDFTGYGVAGGYLMIRLAGPADPGRPQAAAVHLLLAPEGTLGADPEYARARALSPGDDAFFFAQPVAVRALFDHVGYRGDLDLVGGAGVGFTVSERQVELAAGIPLERETAAEMMRSFRASKTPARHAEDAPAGAVGFLSLSFSPLRLLDTFFSQPMERAAAEAAAMQAFGIRLTDTVKAFSGNAALAVYLDPRGMLTSALDAARGEPALTPARTPPVVAFLELSSPDVAAESLGPALVKLGAAKGRAAKGRNRLELDSGVVEFQGDTMRLATASARTILDRPPGGPALLEAIGRDVLERPGEQALYVDVAACVDALVAARAESVDELAAQALLRSQLASLAPLKDLLLHGGVAAGGIEARLRIRLRPQAVSH